MTEDRPLILFTNDDGIKSPGLWAVVQAFTDLGDVLVCAPRRQQSGTGRSMPVTSRGSIHPLKMSINGGEYTVYAVDGTPAQSVQHMVLELAPRWPSLLVSGINYGENTGNGVTISGTIGAAMEAASFEIPALAVSQQTPTDLHMTYSDRVDFSVAARFARRFGEWMIQRRFPKDLDFLKIDVPIGVTDETPWRVTRMSRRRVYWPTRPERNSLSGTGRLGYHFDTEPASAEPDSDVYAVLHERIVSVTPMSLDMTSRLDLAFLQDMLQDESEVSG